MDWPHNIRKDIADTYSNSTGVDLRSVLGHHSLWWLTGVYIVVPHQEFLNKITNSNEY